jgi:antitoxin VapB
MALNIKNERVHELAREAAQRLGTSQTSAIGQALEELLARHRDEAAEAERHARVRRRLAEMHRLVGDQPLMDHDELYDRETGLPA